ncbi:MAG: hypothetical protein GC155_05225 [Alphaproteobacteria bacterium]|nr:hypothetical protein [Alphaproteobacteria bacterium]
MRHAMGLLVLAGLAPPVHALGVRDDVSAVVNRYVDLFDRGDASALAHDIYRIDGVSADAKQTELAAQFKHLTDEQFSNIELYGVDICPAGDDHATALMRFGLRYTFGGLMPPGDQAKSLDLAKTADGWRITGETAAPFDQKLSCKDDPAP